MGGVERIVLIGFSGTGKSTVARLVAERLGWTCADLDAEIERHWDASIPTIFREHGEAAFRASEQSILRHVLQQDDVVVATGGGAPVDLEVWTADGLARPGTLVIALDARPETSLDRLQRQVAHAGEAVERPMLAGHDPLSSIRNLKAARQSVYDRAHITLGVDDIAAEQVVDEVVAVAGIDPGNPLTLRLEAASGASEIRVAAGALAQLGSAIRDRWARAQRVWIVTDDHVGRWHAQAATESLRQSGFSVACYAVRPGEGSKSLATTGELYDWLLGSGIERGDVIVALGGGVVGDLAGFVAATVLRGVGLVQVPTSLLAAVDSSVGGKTGINHAAGKNLIGAFLQPSLVIADTALLQTMPQREWRSGWAEVIKHAAIQRSTPSGERSDLGSFLDRNAARLSRLEEPVTAYAIWRNIALKAAVVAADERETGIRAYLNFGHTLGHAIEAAEYSLLHGEAVGLGMRAAARIGILCGTCDAEDANQIVARIERFGLPIAAPLNAERVLPLLMSDKKRVAGRQRFVLPLRGGGVTMRDEVPASFVTEALATVNSRLTAA